MRLGTKILLLTLSLVVGLTVTIVLVVRDRIKAQELVRTPAAIHRAVGEYFERIEAAAANAESVSTLLFGDPATRAELKNLTDAEGMKPDDATTVQFREGILNKALQPKLTVRLLSGMEAPPDFQVLFSESGRRLVEVAPGSAKLEAGLRVPEIPWPVDTMIEGSGKRVVRYLRIDGGLYLTFGVPLSTSAREGEPPTNAYFVGYRVNERWAAGFIRPDDQKMTTAPLAVWFTNENQPFIEAFGGSLPMNGMREAEKWANLIWTEAKALPLNAPPAPLRVEASVEGTLLAEAVAFEPAPGQRMVLAVTASLDDALAPMTRLLRTITLVGTAAIILAFIACRWIAARISRPVRQLVTEAERIGHGEFDVKLDTVRKDELGDLARGFTHMAQGLAQRDFIKDTFGKFVDPSIVAGLIEDPQRLRPGGEERIQTVLMSDIEGFTSLSEKLRPEQVVSLLNEHLGASADIVTAEKGVVDKFIGDAVVAFWGPPLTEDHTPRACRAALRMVDAAAKLSTRCAELGIPELRIRIGIATGNMLVGNIGSTSKFNYTVMGDTVNLCARLEGINKLYGTTVVINDLAAQSLPAYEGWVIRELDTVRVLGRAGSTRVFELLAAPGDDNRGAITRREAYEAAHRLYIERRWTEAREAFDALATSFPSDAAAKSMALRCARFEAIEPEPGWDGVWVLGTK